MLAGFLLLLLDRRWIDRRTPPEPEPEPDVGPEETLSDLQRRSSPRVPERRSPFPLWRPWRFAAGIALGCAFSVKWSGAMAIFAALILSFAWETTRRRRHDVSLGRAFARAVASGEPGPVHRVPAAAGGRLLHRVPAVVQPLRLEPEGLVGEPDRDARVPQEPADDRARHRDEHVHADAPVLLARVDVALHVAAGQLLLARRRSRTSRRSWPSGTRRSSGPASGRSRSSP